MRHALLSIFALAASSAFAVDRLNHEPIWEYEDGRWAGLRVGRTTLRDLESGYGGRYDGRGSVRLNFSDRTRGTVTALFAEDTRNRPQGNNREWERGNQYYNNPVVEAIRIDYSGDEPSLSEMDRRMKHRGNEFWRKGRQGDWSLMVYEHEGVIAVVQGSGRDRRARTFFLIAPSRMSTVLRPYSSQATSRGNDGGLLEQIFGGGRDRDNQDNRQQYSDYAVFGRITMNLNYSGNMPRGMRSSDNPRFRTWATQELRDLRSGAMRYDSRSSGEVRIDARWTEFDRNDDDGKLEIRASFRSNGLDIRDDYESNVNGDYRGEWERGMRHVISELQKKTDRELDRGWNDSRDNGRNDGRALSLNDALAELTRAATGVGNDSYLGGRPGFRRGG